MRMWTSEREGHLWGTPPGKEGPLAMKQSMNKCDVFEVLWKDGKMRILYYSTLEIYVPSNMVKQDHRKRSQKI